MIHLAANSESPSENKIATLKYLIEEIGVNVDLKDASESTPITYAGLFICIHIYVTRVSENWRC